MAADASSRSVSFVATSVNRYQERFVGAWSLRHKGLRMQRCELYCCKTRSICRPLAEELRQIGFYWNVWRLGGTRPSPFVLHSPVRKSGRATMQHSRQRWGIGALSFEITPK